MKLSEKRALESSWEKLLKRHSKPLEKGAKYNGLPYTEVVVTAPMPYRRTSVLDNAPSLVLKDATFTFSKRDSPSLQEAKQLLKTRVGQAYHKGGLQLLTNMDVEEQKTGAHRRRS